MKEACILRLPSKTRVTIKSDCSLYRSPSLLTCRRQQRAAVERSRSFTGACKYSVQQNSQAAGPPIELLAPEPAEPQPEPFALASLHARFGASAHRSPAMPLGSPSCFPSGTTYPEWIAPASTQVGPTALASAPASAFAAKVAAEQDTSALPEYENARAQSATVKSAGEGVFRFDSGCNSGGWDGGASHGSSAHTSSSYVTPVGVPLVGARPRASTSGEREMSYDAPAQHSQRSASVVKGPAAGVDPRTMNQL